MTSVNRTRTGPRAELAIVIAAEVALVAALHWIGGTAGTVPLRSLADWLQTADPTSVLLAVARTAGLAIGWWLLLTTVLYAAAYHLGSASLIRALRWITLPVVRRLVQGVAAASLSGVSLVGPAAFSVAPALAQPVVVAQTDSSQPADGQYSPEAAGWPSDSTVVNGNFWAPDGLSTSSPTPAPAPSTTGAQAGAETYQVRSGDHLWSIAENHLRTVLKRSVTEDEVASYWVKVVDANRRTVRSGDPDLIYPGEQVTLPPVLAS